MRWKPAVGVALLASATFVVGHALALPITATDESPRLLPYTGHLDEDGQPVEGTRSLQVSIVDATDAVLWTSASRGVNFREGAFAMVLGEAPDPALPDAVFGSEEIYVKVAVEGTLLGGKQRILSTPFAVRATSAYEASAGGPLRASIDDLEQLLGTGVIVQNPPFVSDGLVLTIGEARAYYSNGNGDYRIRGFTTCTEGRVFTIGYSGGGGVSTLRHNACGATSPCFPLVMKAGADLAFSGSLGGVRTFMCLANRWYET